MVPAGESLHLVAFGGFGGGRAEQAGTAASIARHHQQEPFNLGITLGDNFYRFGVRGVKDKKWKTRWETLYTPLHIPFYAALGNHDYGHPPIVCLFRRGSVQAQIDYSERSDSWRMPARHYTYAAGPVRFIAIDTEGWNKDQLDWIRRTLAATAAEPGRHLAHRLRPPPHVHFPGCI